MRTTLVPVLCLAGCVLAPAIAGAQAQAIPDRLSLADALRLAEQGNPALASARQQAAMADADALAARQRPNPTASVLSEDYNGTPSDVGFFDKQELTVQVSQEIETAGRRRLRRQGAAALVASSRSTLEDQRRQLRLDVQRAYFELALARLDSDTARASLAEIDTEIALNRTRYEQGEISGGELRRLEVERIKFTDDVLATDLALRHARSGLLALLGAARLDQPIEPGDTLAVSSGARAPDVAALVTQALGARPDVAAARQEQARAQAGLGLQEALRTPNLSIDAGIKRNFGSNGAVLGVSVPLPVFDRNAAGIARAHNEQRLADSRLRERELAVALDVQQAADLVDISRRRLAYLEGEYLDKARRARDAVLAAYRAGEGGLLDYLDAQRVYREVQRAYNRALFEHRLSLCQLDAAVAAPTGGPQS